MEEPLKPNLQAGVGEVHLSQGTVEGTEADMGIQRKWVRVNRVKRALKGEKPPARPRGEWNRGLNLGRKPGGTQGKADASPWRRRLPLPPASTAASAPPSGGFPKLSTGQSPAGPGPVGATGHENAQECALGTRLQLSHLTG